jgi:hypothetical protein
MASALGFTPVIRYHQIDGGATLILDMDIYNWDSFVDFSLLDIDITSEVNGVSETVSVASKVKTLLTGTASGTINTTAITGVGTLFLSELVVGDLLQFGTTDALFEVLSITSDTVLALKYPLTATQVGQSVNKFEDWIPVYSSDASLGTVWPDDIYTLKFKFTFSGATNTYGTYESQVAMNSQVECAIRGLIVSIPNFPLNDPCSYEWVNEIARNYMLLQALKDAGANGVVDQYTYILTGLENIAELSKDCRC